jgi:hypothetical protein
MGKIEPMDILQAPSKNDIIVARTCQWIKTSNDDPKTKTSTIVFKKILLKNFKIIRT